LGFQDPLVADLVVAIDGAKDLLAGIVVPDADGHGAAHGVAVRLIVGVALVGTIVVVAVAVTGFCLRATRPDWAAAEEGSS
jgi:hypothetical protein